MQDDLSVGRVGSPLLRPEAIPPPRPAEPAAGARPATGHPNPTVRLDPALAVVLVAFQVAHGAVAT